MNPSGKGCSIGTNLGRVYNRELKTNGDSYSFVAHSRDKNIPITDMSYNLPFNELTTCGDLLIRNWDVENRKRTKFSNALEAPVQNIAWNEEGTKLLVVTTVRQTPEVKSQVFILNYETEDREKPWQRRNNHSWR
jgi:hypothetical protein